MKQITSLGRKFFNQQDIRKLQIHLKEITSIVNRLNKTIDLELKECKSEQKQCTKEKYKYGSNLYYSKREGMGC